ncbi:MAG: hypothetical protein JO142_20335 [Burkholderiales bacterium]|nr:hypothetical protein [Burkholderiales bacterium]
MADVWLENVGSKVTKENVQAFLTQCGLPPCDEMLHLPAGRVPGILIRFRGVSVGTMHALRSQIHHKLLQGRRVSAFVMCFVWD